MKSKFFLIFSIAYFSANSQDTIASGSYKQVLPVKFDKELIEKQCIENAKLNAIENVYGFSLTQINESQVLQESKANGTNFQSNFNSKTTSSVAGRWVRDLQHPTIKYYDADNLQWISVAVKGIVKELAKINFSYDRLALNDFVRKTYNKEAFEGVKVIENYSVRYLISVVSLEKGKYNSSSNMNRVAQAKSNSQVNTFLNGASITSEFIIRTNKNDNSTSTIQTTELIKENANGFVSGMEILTNFDINEHAKTVYIFFREVKI